VNHYVDSEVGRLETVLLHRPGPELARLTPRNNDSLLFDGIPWVGRAQEEHDTFAEALRSRGVTVLYLADLLTEVLGVGPARKELTEAVLADVRLGDTLRKRVADYLADLDPTELAVALMAGVAHHELRTGIRSSSIRCPTCCSPAIRACGSGTTPRSPAWPCRPAPGKPR
jgi:arginine deiminase